MSFAPSAGEAVGEFVFGLSKFIEEADAGTRAYEQIKEEARADARKRGIAHVINLDPERGVD